MSGAFTCRACGSPDCERVLSLGRTPLANALLTDATLDAPEDTFPLDVVFCRACTLVQISETVPPEKMFREYAYFSSFSETMLRHARDIATRLVAERGLTAKSLVAEVASNDGYLLQYYHQAGIPVLGVEPAENIAAVARERGVRTIAEFFGERLAGTLAAGGTRADVIHANNVLAHIPDLPGVARAFATLLALEGVAVIEVPYLKDLIDHCEFDTVYHEHLSYFSLTALHRLFAAHGLRVVDVERIPIHGGSLRVFAARADSTAAVRAAVGALLDEERAWGVERPEFYRGFAARVENVRRTLVDLVATLKSQGKKLAAYGAAAKGSTLLNYAGIGREAIDFVADRSTYKQGRYMPGVRLPIVAPSRLLESMPDYVLLLTWNFADEILAQQAEYRHRGGRFIIPIPDVRIV